MKIKEFVYFYGFALGIALVISPIAYDLIWMGTRNALIWSVGVVGMAVQVVGLFLMWSGGRDAK